MLQDDILLLPEKENTMKPLTIIMVGRNHLEQTQKAIESLVKYTDKSQYSLIFFDNAGSDHTDGWIIPFCREHGIDFRYIYSPDNRGYIGAVNHCYNLVETPYSLTCHNDVEFSLQWMERMLRRFRDETIAAVGPVISFAMGPQAQRFAYLTFGVEVKYILGLFFMCRTSVLSEIKKDTGEYLPTIYGLGDKEELELCYKIRQLGYKFEIARDVYIKHEGEKSFVDTLGSQQAFYEYQNKQLTILRDRLGNDIVNDIYSINITKPVKILVGILTRTEYVHYRNMISFLKVWGMTQVYKDFYHVGRAHSAVARNIIVKAFLKGDYTHLLFIDDDMIFEGDAINKLLAMDVDIATGIAYQRGEPHSPCIFLFNPDNKSLYPVEAVRDKESRGQSQVDAIGGYFILAKRKVFEGVEYPWFKYGDTSLGINDSVDPEEKGIGEDVYFSAKAKMAGFEVWVDTSVEIKHIGQEREIDSDYFFSYKDSGKLQEAIDERDKFKKM